MSIAGTRMHDPNFRLRVLLLVFGGIISSAVVLYWRSEYLVSQEYIEFPAKTPIASGHKLVPSAVVEELNN